MIGQSVKDAWIFDLIPETETGEGWLLGGIQNPQDKVNAEWDKYG